MFHGHSSCHLDTNLHNVRHLAKSLFHAHAVCPLAIHQNNKLHLHAYRYHDHELCLLSILHHRDLHLRGSAFQAHLPYLKPNILRIWYRLAILECHVHLSVHSATLQCIRPHFPSSAAVALF